MFQWLGSFIARHWLPVLVAWILFAVVLHMFAPRWNDITNDGDFAYLPASMPSVEGERLIAEAFPDARAKSQIALVVERPGGPLTSADLQWSDRLAERFRDRAQELAISDVWNRHTEIIGERLTSRVSKNGQATVTMLHIKNEFMAVGNIRLLQDVQSDLAELQRDAPEGVNVGITGSAAIGADMLRSAAESIKNTELTTILMVVFILLVVYRAPLLVLIPLLTIGLTVLVSTDLLAALTQLFRVPGFSWWNFKVFTTTRIFIVVILFGAGTDFCLFLISRYREELARGLSRSEAVAESISRVGEALVASAMTTICGLGMMFFADFGKFRNSGPAIALALAVTLIASLTMAPALLRAMGRVVFWPLKAPASPTVSAHGTGDPVRRSNRFWQWAANVIVRRPGLILITSVVLMTPLAYEGFDVPLTYDLLNELDKTCPSVSGTQLVRRHYPSGEMAPATMLAYKKGVNFEEGAGEREIARLTKRLYDVPGVAKVLSIAAPTGDPPGYFQPFRTSGLKKLAALKHKTTRALYVTEVPGLAGEVARFEIIMQDDPFSPQAIATLDRVARFLERFRTDPKSSWHEAKFVFAGTTAGIRDLKQVTQSDERLIKQLVVLAVMGVLVILLRRPVVCLYLIVSVLFSYFVTIGATELFFTWLYGDTFYGLDWKVPLFLFVILIAVGEDYNIYLLTRVVEEQHRFGPLEGLRRAVAHTGGIITSCGVIMAGTFVSMMTGTLRGILELGFALSLGVMLDTCIVRPVLVPAFLSLMERLRQRGTPSTVPPQAAPNEPQVVAKG